MELVPSRRQELRLSCRSSYPNPVPIGELYFHACGSRLPISLRGAVQRGDATNVGSIVPAIQWCPHPDGPCKRMKTGMGVQWGDWRRRGGRECQLFHLKPEPESPNQDQSNTEQEGAAEWS